ncbi:MAG: sarcosine oxidase subunit gamma [Alphaproteobacteria bacterium]|nr:sarcosine oxidase subunit gamma [Alphaproteobacteria bacterium]
MVDLIAKSPLQDLLPVSAGETTLTEATPANITSISVHKGREKPLAEALKKAHDLTLPAIGRTSSKAGLSLIWSGRGQHMLLGDKQAARALARTSSLTDQTDGWAVMRLTGANAPDILARLCPLDLRAANFKRGHTARTEVAHMMTVVTRLNDGFEIMVMRSFAATMVHHLTQAMQSVAAQELMPSSVSSSP